MTTAVYLDLENDQVEHFLNAYYSRYEFASFGPAATKKMI